MSANKLKLNERKTEFMVTGKEASPQTLRTGKFIVMSDECIVAAEVVRNIGVRIDSELDMSAQTDSICRAAHMHLHDVGKMRHFLTKNSTATLAHAFVTSKLDNCNSLLSGCPEHKLNTLQKLQNTSVHFIAKTKKYNHIILVPGDLHWLPVRACIVFKICVLVFSYLQRKAPVLAGAHHPHTSHLAPSVYPISSC